LLWFVDWINAGGCLYHRYGLASKAQHQDGAAINLIKPLLFHFCVIVVIVVIVVIAVIVVISVAFGMVDAEPPTSGRQPTR
jgi:hypothetical protein